jgi:hypothetical protein
LHYIRLRKAPEPEPHNSPVLDSEPEPELTRNDAAPQYWIAVLPGGSRHREAVQTVFLCQDLCEHIVKYIALNFLM